MVRKELSNDWIDEKMYPLSLNQMLRFYFITDDRVPACPPIEQVKIALAAGATIIQYRNKSFSSEDINAVKSIQALCARHLAPLIINDHILLALAVSADGVHLGQTDENAAMARRLLGPDTIIGISVSTMEEFEKTDFSGCDYIGTGPVFRTKTKSDAKAVIGLAGLQKIIGRSSLPVVAIGGIDDSNAKACLSHGAAGVAVISCISRSEQPALSAAKLSKVCGCAPRKLKTAWSDEFLLIQRITDSKRIDKAASSILKVAPGDDAALLCAVSHPVISTDTQKENIHFRRQWQTLAEIGQKAVEITFSDLAASYARPLSLFVNLSIPPYISDSDIENLYSGIERVLEKYQAALGGGNISSGRELSIDLFAIGDGDPNIFPLRSNARPGDGLYVSGALGQARAGLACLQNKNLTYPQFIRKFKHPMARFDAAKILCQYKVSCVMDISDGLAGDAHHMAEASNLSITLTPSCFIRDPLLKKFCRQYPLNVEQTMIAGGEDYELLFACRPEIFDQIKIKLPSAFQVGQCMAFSGKRIMNLPTDIFAFQHGNQKLLTTEKKENAREIQ